MSLPTPYMLGVKRRLEVSKDSHGKKVTTYGPEQQWYVSGIAPGPNAEPNNPNRDLSLILWTVYAPVSEGTPGELDRVVLEGEEYAVEGRAADWTNGPWENPIAGVVVELKRVEG